MNTENKITGPTVRDFDWDGNRMQHQGLSCAKHPGCRWVTKHPWDRSVHYVAELTPECDCPVASLIVED